MRSRILQAYRLAVFVAAVMLAHGHRTTLGIAASTGVALREVQALLPAAAHLEADGAPLGGLAVLDAGGRPIGRALTTSPVADAVVGYAGPADTLVVIDAEERIAGVRLRWSADTQSHVADVVADAAFWNAWRGLRADRVATATLRELGIEGVSGATRTSLCIAEGIGLRLRGAGDPPPTATTAGLHDLALLAAIVAALLLSLLHDRRRRLARRVLQVFVIGYVGLLTGDLLAWSLFAGWAANGVPWRATPGLVALAATALVVPWATGRPVYCAHLCAHGALQEWIGRVAPKRWQLALPAWLRGALAALPVLLLALITVTVMLSLPLDVAGLEPFDAWLPASAGLATLVVAALGLLAAVFEPMAYCRFGCPTGALLRYVRSHGRADRFGARDVLALLLLLVAVGCAAGGGALRTWLAEAPPL